MKKAGVTKRVLWVGFLLWMGVSLEVAAGGRDYSRIVAFGDSLSDPGNAFVLLKDLEIPPFDLIPDAPYARGGLHFSNGETWVEQLAATLRVNASAGPALRAPGPFSNYAVGGARARAGGPFDLTTQVAVFLEDAGGVAPPDALYVIFIGGNDLRDALASLPADPAPVLSAALTAIQDNIAALAAAGARTFLIANAPNLAVVPAVRFAGPAAQAAGQFLSLQFNGALDAVLGGLEAGLRVTIVRFDVFGLVNQVVANPAAAGLVQAQLPCLTFGTRAHAYCLHPDQYLFWDGIHPTRAGHALLAGGAYRALLLR